MAQIAKPIPTGYEIPYNCHWVKIILKCCPSASWTGMSMALPYTRPMGYRASKIGWSVGASSIGLVGFSGMPHPLFNCKTDVLLVEGPWRMVSSVPPSIVPSECIGQQWDCSGGNSKYVIGWPCGYWSVA